MRQIMFKYLIDDRDRVDDQWIICRTRSQPDQLEKIPADDIPSLVLTAAIGNLDYSIIGIDRSVRLLWDWRE